MRATTRLRASAILLGFVISADPCCGQGSIHFTFDGPPPVARGTGRVVQEYYESSMWFTPIDTNAPWAGFVRNGGGIVGVNGATFPDNGTAYIQADITSTLRFGFLDGSAFDLFSVDLAGYSSVVPDSTTHFVGYRADGSTVEVSVDSHGLDFQTYYFGADFSNLARVEIPTYWGSLDNLVVSVPEPGGLTLLSLAAGLCVVRLRQRRVPPVTRSMRANCFLM